MNIAPLALKVLLLAGGGEADTNYQSHLDHVERLRTLLEARGVPPDAMVVFWADGRDPGPDRAVRRRPDVEGAWLLEGTPLDARTDPGLELEDTRIEGVEVHPATRDALRRWLARAGPSLGPDATLLIAVTDHGAPGPRVGDDRPPNPSVVLWGEHWSVDDAAEDLALLPPGPRVVLWMSQCYSGGFARLAEERPDLCGVFSANPDRVAYGCYAGLADSPDIGHFHRLVDALERHADLGGASDEAMLTDETPDTPHRTSDAFLYDALREKAKGAGTSLAALVDEAMSAAPADAPPRRAARAVAEAYGLGELPDFGAVLRRLRALGERRRRLVEWGDHWRRLLDEARARLAGTVEAPWPGAAPSAEALQSMRARLVTRLRDAVARTPGLAGRLEAIRERATRARPLEVRHDVYAAAVRRVGYLYLRLAAGALEPADRRRWEALRRCEEAPLLPAPETAASPPRPPRLGPLASHEAAIDALAPGWLGVRYREVDGGVDVVEVAPDGPAASLKPGGRLVAAGGVALATPGTFAQVAALAPPGRPLELTLADGSAVTVEAVAEAPRAGGAPGEPLPALSLVPLRGGGAFTAGGRPTVLYFWTTWCKVCRRAPPILSAWAEANGGRVVAISPEARDDVEAYLARADARPFEEWLDPDGLAHEALEIDAYPTFILVDAAGRVVGRVQGLPRSGALPRDWGEPSPTTLR